MTKLSFLVFIALLFLAQHVHGVSFPLNSYRTEYFMKELKKGDIVRVNWEVRKGRAWNIDAVIYDPNRKDVMRWTQKSWGSHSFTAEHDGLHEFVFSNKRFDKTVNFELELGESATKSLDSSDPIQRSLAFLHEGFGKISRQQSLLRQRELNARSLVEDINERIKWWGIGEAILIAIMSWWQVYYLKKVFNVKSHRV